MYDSFVPKTSPSTSARVGEAARPLPPRALPGRLVPLLPAP